MKYIDNLVDKITMYRLMLYFLLILVGLGFFIQPPLKLAISLLILISISWLTNTIFAKIFKAPTNLESVYISALILALTISPDNYFLLFISAIIANASKYILAVNRKHIFNPVAITLVIVGNASWWIVTPMTIPIILIGGLLIIYKLRKPEMLLAFFAVALLIPFLRGDSLRGLFLYSPLLFFAFAMFTEPLTSPTSKIWQIVYGLLIGILFNIRGISPEIALIAGNILAYLVSSKEKLILILKEKIQIAPNIYEFIFESSKKLNFKPGQYLEWTLPQEKPDWRGSRRYLTIASSPTEDNIRVGTKYYEKSSTFKKTLFDLNTPIIASQLAGDFTLPKDPKTKLTFVAGGIGITPFRSMIKFLIDTKQIRDIILIYINKSADEIVYKDIIEKVKVFYINTSEVGYLNAKNILDFTPDFLDRSWYISGPHNMVTATEHLLKNMGIKHIKTDFFPGLV